jgi:hypothetical protein
MTRRVGAHEVSPDIPGSIDVPTIKAISGLNSEEESTQVEARCKWGFPLWTYSTERVITGKKSLPATNPQFSRECPFFLSDLAALRYNASSHTFCPGVLP